MRAGILQPEQVSEANHDNPANHQYAPQDVGYSFASLEQAKPPLIYQIADQAQSFFVEYPLCIGVGFEVVDARPDLGRKRLRQMHSFRTAEGQELLWQGDPEYWPDHAPILFPLISQMPDGHIRHGGRAYPMPPHGFAQSRDFAVSEQTESSCVFELRDDAETRAHYPFAFTLRIGFELSDDGLLVTMTVENPNDEPMPADVGFHPGFNWPLTLGHDKHEYTIVFAEEEPAPIRRGADDPILLYPEGRPTPVEGNVLRLRDELFEEQAIVFDRLNSRSVVYGAPGTLCLRIDFPDSPHLGILSWCRSTSSRSATRS